MGSDVPEGISTSLETCPPFPKPQELDALMGCSTTTYLQENDLGLTPSPGSRLQESTDSSHQPSQDEGICSDEAVPLADFSAHLDCFGLAKDKITRRPGNQHSIALSSDEETASAAQISYGQQSAVGSEELYDPLFDEAFAIPELDSVFLPREGEEDVEGARERKRTSEEAFPQDFELWALPEKRQHVESPEETPSLTYSSTQQSPASFFDTFDLLFGDSTNDTPVDLGNDICPEIPTFLTSQVEEVAQPSMSDSTKERFLLGSQDLLANSTREILQVCKEPEYVSPYPAAGGALGYFPSTPGIHAKFIEASDERTHSRLSNLRTKVQRLTCERNHYKKVLSQHPKMDETTGKTAEQLLREENAMLRRVSSRHQGRVEQYKKEAAEWKGKLHDLGVIYNNLLYEIRVQKRIPTVAPIPTGYKPPRLSTPMEGHIPLLDAPSATQPPPPPPPPPTATQMVVPRPEPVTIDLTDENDDTPPNSPPEDRERRMAMLQSLRNKKYDWLGAEGQHGGSESRIHDDRLAQLMEEELARAT
ncbi:hypothetical protein ARAM_006720 [Aspergillus rambellii]|uniref:Uncharacterized protein n=1 Tax=Aspergillus rambellii TaxID=308745 RepID=A0A0F8VVN1_9EURO|nr:hypothetical protein ARAM_006720 [Aspergillus rambellii]